VVVVVVGVEVVVVVLPGAFAHLSLAHPPPPAAARAVENVSKTPNVAVDSAATTRFIISTSAGDTTKVEPSMPKNRRFACR
jgi:hypothetical protein